MSSPPGSTARSGETPAAFDKEAFMRLARANESVLVRVARRLCGHDVDFADDCVQEALILAYKAMADGKFTDVGNFRPWVLRIMTNHFFRESGRRNRFTTSDEIESIIDRQSAWDSHRDIASVVETAALRDEIELALGELSEDQRACVVLVDLEEMEYADAAQVLGVPVGTVRSRLNRARLKMADVITRKRLGELI